MSIAVLPSTLAFMQLNDWSEMRLVPPSAVLLSRERALFEGAARVQSNKL
jgi:hypothetical protein